MIVPKLIVGFFDNVGHEVTALIKEVEVVHCFKTIGDGIVGKMLGIVIWAILSFEFVNILSWSIIRNSDVGSVIKICEICQLIAVAIRFNANSLKIMLREDMVLVYRLLFTTGADNPIPRLRRV